MDAEQERKLERIKGYVTHYEVILSNGTAKYRVGYTARHSQQGVRSLTTKNYDSIKRVAGTSEVWWIKPKEGFHKGEWWIGFSGRTQRESIIEGELDWVGSDALNRVLIPGTDSVRVAGKSFPSETNIPPHLPIKGERYTN